MKKIGLIISFILHAGLLLAQSGNASLLLQSPDGQTVKLMWFLKEWESGAKGFDVKRREGNGSWTTLNKATIQPEISKGKDLSIVQPDQAALSKLQAKQTTLINNKKLKEVSNQAYVERLSSDKNAVRDVAIMTALDYDVALINGFGFIDNAANKGGKYEYGVFYAGNSKPIATVKWNGETPDLNIIRDVRSKKAGDRAQILWSADTAKMKQAHVSGFYIYRGDHRLNQTPVMANSNKEMSSFTWFDSLASKSAPSRYSIIPVTLFNIEGTPTEYTYDPSRFPSTYDAADVLNISSKSEGREKGMLIKWNLPEKSRGYVKGYLVERSDLPKGYIPASTLLPVSTSEYRDTVLPKPGDYVKYRVVAIYEDSTIVPGAEQLFVYFPDTRPDAPKGVKAKWVKEGDKLYAELSWLPKRADDDLTEYYQIYATSPVDGKMYLEQGLPPIKGNSYRYELKYEQASRYKFIVAAVSKYKVEGYRSDTVAVMAPSQHMPIPTVKQVSLTDSNKVTIQWDYPEVWDLKGFRLYQNGNLVGSEFQINKDTKQITTPGLKWKANYAFSVQAVSEHGVTSYVSTPASITIYSDPKK